jgi:hypothetical protein
MSAKDKGKDDDDMSIAGRVIPAIIVFYIIEQAE